MEPNQPKVRLDQQRQQASVENLRHATEPQQGHRFDSIEAILRRDRDMVPIPDSLAERLDASLLELPPPPPWWKRWLGLR